MAKNSEMDLMPIFFCKIIYFLLDYDVDGSEYTHTAVFEQQIELLELKKEHIENTYKAIKNGKAQFMSVYLQKRLPEIILSRYRRILT